MLGYLTYTADLQSHIRDIQAHSRGDDDAFWGPADLPYSVIAPWTIWTPGEKNTLFSAVSRYSYLRPDLISQCVGSKTDVEVCCYLQTLREAASRVESLGYGRIPASREADEQQVAFEEKASRQLTRSQVTGKRKRDQGKADGNGPPMKKRVPLSRAMLQKMESQVKLNSSMEEQVSDSESEEIEEDCTQPLVSEQDRNMDLLRYDGLTFCMNLYSNMAKKDSSNLSIEPIVVAALREQLIRWTQRAVHRVISYTEAWRAAKNAPTRTDSLDVRVNHVTEALSVHGYPRKKRDLYGALNPDHVDMEEDAEETEDEALGDHKQESKPTEALPVSHEPAFLAILFHSDLAERASGTMQPEHVEETLDDEINIIADTNESEADDSSVEGSDQIEDALENKMLKQRYGWKKRKPVPDFDDDMSSIEVSFV